MLRSAALPLASLGLVVGLGLVACGGGSSSPDTTPDAPSAVIGDDATVVALDGEHVYFGDENRREVDVPVTFPEAGQRYRSVTLRFALRCPDGGCDWWDRRGHLSLVRGTGDDAVEIELARFMTPYRVGMAADLDVTDLQRLLEGDVTLRVFIDTWVGPGHANGAGWLVDARFEFVGGMPDGGDPFAVIPVFAPGGVVYGDPLRPWAQAATVDVPAGATGARLYTIVTGHGQGNAGNCAEFCSRYHTVTVGDAEVGATIWRDDCATTAAPGQQGTWQYPRAGWCPGATVTPWVADVAAPPAGALTVGWDVEAYDNTCRPDSETCVGCTLGTGCDYDGGAHTEPYYDLSALLVLVR